MRADRIQAWQEARRILAIRLDGMGDVLMTTPALRALAEGGISPHITLLTSPAAAEVAELVPEIDDVIVFDAPWVKSAPQGLPAETTLAMAERLQAGAFDAAVVFAVATQNPMPAVMLAYLAGIPLRLAYCRENPYQLLSDWAPDLEQMGSMRHEVVRQLDLVRCVGFDTTKTTLSLKVTPEARECVERLISDAGLSWSRLVVMHPGATAPARRYSPEQFAEVLRGLHDAGWQAVLTGSVDERALVDQVRAMSGTPAVSFAGRLSVAELAALIANARVLVANNSGPVHIAAAVGTPVVDLYALTNPQHTPWQVPSRVLSHDVPCRNCLKSVCPEGHHDCLRLVSPRQVIDAVGELIEQPDLCESAQVAF